MENEEMKSQLRSYLESILKSKKLIDKVMEDIPHEDGRVSITLKPQSKQYVSHSKRSIEAVYRDKDGKRYLISILEV